jgi:hypothetical protein
MSQPVKLSDALVLEARIVGKAEQRSIAGQVEFWALLGRSLDGLLHGSERRAFRENVAAKPLSQLIATVGMPEGKARLKAHLESLPFPHFEPHPTLKGYLVRIEENGSRSVGRFVNREFIVAQEKARGHSGIHAKNLPRFKQVVFRKAKKGSSKAKVA